MPELPEVQTVVNQLAPRLIGRRIRSLMIYDSKLELPRPEQLAGWRIRRVWRAGKQIALELGGAKKDEAALWLLIHLRMTGRLVWRNGRAQAPAVVERAPRFELELDRGRLLFFDTRRFGTLLLCGDPAQLRAPGLDPLSRAFTARKLAGLLRSGDQPLKAFLMRQDKITGLGNIYASEILFTARLSPFRRTADLPEAVIEELYRAIRKILRRAVRYCGTTFSDFQDAHGVSGNYQRLLQVYGRVGQPCARCGVAIRRAVQQQRSTFYCPHCQN